MITSHGRDPAIKSASTPTIVSGIDQGEDLWPRILPIIGSKLMTPRQDAKIVEGKEKPFCFR
jgi:hypothetical protein